MLLPLQLRTQSIALSRAQQVGVAGVGRGVQYKLIQLFNTPVLLAARIKSSGYR